MPELVLSKKQGENLLEILEEKLAELRAEEPKDYNAIGRVRLLIMKTRKEIFPDQDPYLTIDLGYKKLEDQEAWDTKKEKEDVSRKETGNWIKLFFSKLRTKKIIDLLDEEIARLRLQKPKDYRKIARLRVMKIKIDPNSDK